MKRFFIVPTAAVFLSLAPVQAIPAANDAGSPAVAVEPGGQPDTKQAKDAPKTPPTVSGKGEKTKGGKGFILAGIIFILLGLLIRFLPAKGKQ